MKINLIIKDNAEEYFRFLTFFDWERQLEFDAEYLKNVELATGIPQFNETIEIQESNQRYEIELKGETGNRAQSYDLDDQHIYLLTDFLNKHPTRSISLSELYFVQKDNSDESLEDNTDDSLEENTDESLEDILANHLKILKYLDTLLIKNCQFKDENGAFSFHALLPENRLTTYEIERCHLDNASVYSLANSLSENISLKKLSVKNNHFTNPKATTELLEASITHPNLIELNLSGNALFHPIPNISEETSEIDEDEVSILNKTNDHAIEVLANFLGMNTHCKSLFLNGMFNTEHQLPDQVIFLNDKWIEQIGNALIWNRTLNCLHLSHVTNNGMHILANYLKDQFSLIELKCIESDFNKEWFDETIQKPILNRNKWLLQLWEPLLMNMEKIKTAIDTVAKEEKPLEIEWTLIETTFEQIMYLIEYNYNNQQDIEGNPYDLLKLFRQFQLEFLPYLSNHPEQVLIKLLIKSLEHPHDLGVRRNARALLADVLTNLSVKELPDFTLDEKVQAILYFSRYSHSIEGFKLNDHLLKTLPEFNALQEKNATSYTIMRLEECYGKLVQLLNENIDQPRAKKKFKKEEEAEIIIYESLIMDKPYILQPAQLNNQNLILFFNQLNEEAANKEKSLLSKLISNLTLCVDTTPEVSEASVQNIANTSIESLIQQNILFFSLNTDVEKKSHTNGNKRNFSI